jgi:hypothetical protein
MAAEETLTWEISIADGGARRPTIADLGGADFVDDDDYPPPRDGSEPYATEYNATKKTVAAVARVVPNAILTIDFDGGAPFIDKLMAASTNLTAADFTLVDDGVGQTRIQWAAGTLPEIVCDPIASSGAPSGTHIVNVSVTGPTELSVHTFTGVYADIRFTVAIY